MVDVVVVVSMMDMNRINPVVDKTDSTNIHIINMVPDVAVRIGVMHKKLAMVMAKGVAVIHEYLDCRFSGFYFTTDHCCSDDGLLFLANKSS